MSLSRAVPTALVSDTEAWATALGTSGEVSDSGSLEPLGV